MDMLLFLLISAVALSVTPSIQCTSDSEIQEIFHQLKEKLDGINIDIATLAKLKEQLMAEGITDNQKEAKLFPVEQGHVLHKRSQKIDAAQIDPALKSYYQKLSPQDQELLRKHASQSSRLLAAIQEAQHRPVDPAEEVAAEPIKKRQQEDKSWSATLKEMLVHVNALKDALNQAAAQHGIDSTVAKEIKYKILEDAKKAKENGIKLDDLLKSLSQSDTKSDVDDDEA